MKEYFINSNTLAIVPCNGNSSIVYEVGRSFIIKKRPNLIVKRNCIYNGSTLEGRLEGTYNLTGYNYKAPIMINNKSCEVFFPTTSIRLKECVWINSAKIKNYMSLDDDSCCNIYFIDGSSLKINQSSYVINNQILKSLRLDAILRNLKA